jgi:glyoxylate reductase
VVMSRSATTNNLVNAAAELGIAVCTPPRARRTTPTSRAPADPGRSLAHDAEADLRAARWKGWGILQYLGRDVHGATLGLVGFSRTARPSPAGLPASGCRWCTTPATTPGGPAGPATSTSCSPRWTWSACTSSRPRPATSSRRDWAHAPDAVLVNTARAGGRRGRARDRAEG